MTIEGDIVCEASARTLVILGGITSFKRRTHILQYCGHKLRHNAIVRATKKENDDSQYNFKLETRNELDLLRAVSFFFRG